MRIKIQVVHCRWRTGTSTCARPHFAAQLLAHRSEAGVPVQAHFARAAELQVCEGGQQRQRPLLCRAPHASNRTQTASHAAEWGAPGAAATAQWAQRAGQLHGNFYQALAQAFGHAGAGSGPLLLARLTRPAAKVLRSPQMPSIFLIGDWPTAKQGYRTGAPPMRQGR